MIGNPRRYLPLAGLLLCAAAAWLAGGPASLTWSSLAHHQAELTRWASVYPVLSAATYIAAYAVIAALAIPGAWTVTATGGLLFGTVAGTALAVGGATLGATILFLGARPALSSSQQPLLRQIQRGLARDGFFYLIALRLIPVFPFWLVNLAAAAGGMRTRPYVIATLFGMIPASAVFASIGSGLGAVLTRGEEPGFGVILSPTILGPLAGLAVLSLLPVLLRRRMRVNA